MLSGVPNMAMAIRLHQRLVDAQVRSDLRVRLPAAQPHGRARIRAVHAGEPRPVGDRAAVHRLLLGLRAARDRHFPQAGVEGALAALPELRARHPQPQTRRAIEDGTMRFSQTLLYDTDRSPVRVATITLNRPERLNTIVPPMPEELEAAVAKRRSADDRGEGDRPARRGALVLRGLRLRRGLSPLGRGAHHRRATGTRARTSRSARPRRPRARCPSS
jgi:hypothetical protein